MKKQKGITLIALVITIIVMLILVGVTLNVVLNGNLIGNTQDAKEKQEIEIQREQLQSAVWAALDPQTGEVNFDDVVLFGWESQEQGIDHIYTSPKGHKFYIGSNGEVKTLDEMIEAKEEIKKSTAKEDSYVGCYADIDIDGEVDGVIFVDLLTGSIKNTQQFGQGNTYGVYVLPTNVTTNNVKSYYISQDSFTDSHFGTHAVISPKGNSGEDRFYILQLNNFTTPAYIDGEDSSKSYPEYTTYRWYLNAYFKMDPLITSVDFGEGKENTRKMIEVWNTPKSENIYDADQYNEDIWKHIQTKYNEGWFIPSIGEWSAFGNELGVNKNNYNSIYGLSHHYWSSSQCNYASAYDPCFWIGFVSYTSVTIETVSVRLATTF